MEEDVTNPAPLRFRYANAYDRVMDAIGTAGLNAYDVMAEAVGELGAEAVMVRIRYGDGCENNRLTKLAYAVRVMN